MKMFWVAVPSVLLLGACGGGGGSATDSPGLTGPCEVIAEEPVINIDSVSASGEAEVDRVILTNLIINDVRLDLWQEIEPGWTNIEADPTEDTLICTLPCGFSEIEGQYQFTVSAEGFADLPVAVEAVYETFDGGCPAVYSGGVHLELSLPAEQ